MINKNKLLETIKNELDNINLIKNTKTRELKKVSLQNLYNNVILWKD